MAPTRYFPGAILVAIAMGVTGCAAPQATAVSASTASTGSGAYPNLNVPLTPATAQLTPEERAATAEGLRQRRAGLTPAATPPSSADQLRRIGGSHSADAIRRIEGN